MGTPLPQTTSFLDLVVKLAVLLASFLLSASSAGGVGSSSLLCSWLAILFKLIQVFKASISYGLLEVYQKGKPAAIVMMHIECKSFSNSADSRS